MSKATHTRILLLLALLSVSTHGAGDVIEIRAPAPGDPRATEFDKESGETMRLVRDTEMDHKR